MKIQLGTSDPRERALSLDSNPDNRPSFHVKVSFTSLIVLTLSAPWVATSLPGLEDLRDCESKQDATDKVRVSESDECKTSYPLTCCAHWEMNTITMMRLIRSVFLNWTNAKLLIH